jgi:hypothetical protein
VRKVILLCLTFTVGMILLAGCRLEPDLSRVDDGVEFITRKYGVPAERVLEVADLLGVNADEIPSPQDSDPYLPFPIPYFQEQFEAFEREHGRKPLRPEVDEIVKGYKARCEVISAYTDYLFYATTVNRTWLWRKREAAVIMRVYYFVDVGEIYKPELATYEEVTIIDIPLTWDNPWGNFGYIGCARDAERAAGATPAAEP